MARCRFVDGTAQRDLRALTILISARRVGPSLVGVNYRAIEPFVELMWFDPG